MDSEVPFPRSYWVVPGKLLAGPYPGDSDPVMARRKLEALVGAGIRAVINLMEESEKDHHGNSFVPYGPLMEGIAAGNGGTVSCLRFPVRDLGIPAPDGMKKILDAVDRFIFLNMPVYVHCWGGRGRTGTVVGCWLARHGSARAGGALDMIARLRASVPDTGIPSPETGAQRNMVSQWKEGE